jgi:hypothetical protein
MICKHIARTSQAQIYPLQRPLVKILYETGTVYYEKEKIYSILYPNERKMHEPTKYAESVQTVVFWNVTARNIEGGYRRFAGTFQG